MSTAACRIRAPVGENELISMRPSTQEVDLGRGVALVADVGALAEPVDRARLGEPADVGWLATPSRTGVEAMAAVESVGCGRGHRAEPSPRSSRTATPRADVLEARASARAS